ncbi:MAG: hypothetical protein IKL49_11050 [Lachnospiraceae bacterium]|nr:hypothetical protein [Lachnospiraceae bacterium]
MFKRSNRSSNSKSSLILRVVAGFYLVYLAYELFMGRNDPLGAPIVVSVGSAIVFLIFGIYFVVTSAKDFLKGDAKGGTEAVSEETGSADNE